MGQGVVGPVMDYNKGEWKFEPTDPDCGLKTFIGEAIGAASMCWETLEGAGVFDSTRAKAIVDAVYERATRRREEGALLGLATTEELLEEIRTRIEIDGKLQYRTVDSE